MITWRKSSGESNRDMAVIGGRQKPKEGQVKINVDGAFAFSSRFS